MYGVLMRETWVLTFRLQEKYPEVFRILDRAGDGMEIASSVEQIANQVQI
jgi:hypothetical protein